MISKTTSPSILVLLFFTLFIVKIKGAFNIPASAECVSLQAGCTEELATKSGICKPKTPVAAQPEGCKKSACKYCTWPINKDSPICKGWALKYKCVGNLAVQIPETTPEPTSESTPDAASDVAAESTSEAVTDATPDATLEDTSGAAIISLTDVSTEPTPDATIDVMPGVTPEATPADLPDVLPFPDHFKDIYKFMDPEKCMWKGHNDMVAISLANAMPSSHWSKNGEGLIWKKDTLSGVDTYGIEPKCFNFMVPSSGNYYLTAITSAPHAVDHNDMWIKLSAGIALYRVETEKFLHVAFNYIKAYQNYGMDRIANVLFSVDKNPHFFVSKTMVQGESYEVCISGRGSKFTVYKIAMVKCSPDLSCNPFKNHVQSAMRMLEDSICV